MTVTIFSTSWRRSGLAAVVASVGLLGSGQPAKASAYPPPSGAVAFVDQLKCAAGVTELASFVGVGSGTVSGNPSYTMTPGATSVTGSFSGWTSSEAGKKWGVFDYSPQASYYADVDARYQGLGLDMPRPATDGSYRMTWKLGAAKRLFFPIVDFDDSTVVSVSGRRAGAAVAANAIPRGAQAPAVAVEGASVRISRNPALTEGTNDFDTQADVVFDQPVDEVEMTFTVAGPAIAATVAVLRPYTCQGADNATPTAPDLVLGGSVGEPLTGQLQSADPEGDAVTYTVGQLPPGLSIGADGTVSGTPTEPGVTTVEVQACDGTGACSTGRVAFVVHECPDASPTPY